VESEQEPVIEPIIAGLPKTSFLGKVPRVKLVVGSILGLIVLIVTGVAAFAYHGQASKSTGCAGNTCNSNDSRVSATATPVPLTTPTPIARHLDGALVTPGEENVRPLGVMIENHPDARPQSGLSSANWVYEAIAEGGITRFFAMFANPDLGDIRVGPVRSVRTYFLDYAREYNSFLSHVGGNIDALDSIQEKGGITNLDQFSIGSPTYARDFSRNVATEHTMYSTTAKLWTYITNQKYDKVGAYAVLPFTDDAAISVRPASETVAINFSSASFAVSWVYDSTTNSYARSMAGAPHKDANNGTQITAKNIVIQTVAKQTTITRINEQGFIYTLTGSGKVVVVQNGIATEGTWKRQGNERTHYFDAAGKEIPLVRGTTWVEVVHSDIPVTY
jgi:hypothetical protein